MSEYQFLLNQFADLQSFLGWTPSDAERVKSLGVFVRSHFPALVEEFYQEVERHEATRKIITGGPAQIARLKATLIQWLEELFGGDYGPDYLARHWRIGRRHVEIGLKQVYAMAALSRLRNRFVDIITQAREGHSPELHDCLASLHKLIDLDLAIIEEAYDIAFVARENAIERERGDALFRNVVDSAGCVMLILRPDCTMLFANDFAEKLADIMASPQVPQDFLTRHVVESDRRQFSSMIERSLAGENVPAFEAKIIREQGDEISILWNLRPLQEYEINIVVLAVGQDLTGINEAQAKALQAERLAVIGQMSAGLAHEARNALQRIQSCTEMLEYEVGDNAEAKDLVQRSQLAQDQLVHLFEEIRGYAGPIKLDITLSNIGEIWREAWQLLALQRRGRNAELKEELLCEDLSCSVDHFRLVQLFRNLLENSLAACADPVCITVVCQRLNNHDVHCLEVRVRDNGPGFNAEQRRRLFEPFYTTKTRGTGLGMPIAQRIAEMHQGSIVIGEEWNAGAELIITIPIR